MNTNNLHTSVRDVSGATNCKRLRSLLNLAQAGFLCIIFSKMNTFTSNYWEYGHNDLVKLNPIGQSVCHSGFSVGQTTNMG